MIADYTIHTDKEVFEQLTLPILEPVLVAREAEFLPLLQSARASIAMLTLDLRAARKDAEAAEGDLAEAAAGQPGLIDLNVGKVLGEGGDELGTRQWLREILDQRLADSRRELATRVIEVRLDAARRVTSAAASSDGTRRSGEGADASGAP